MTERDQEKHYNQIAESDFHISCGVHFLRLAERLMLFLFMIIIKWVRGSILAPVMFKWVSGLSVRDEFKVVPQYHIAHPYWHDFRVISARK